MRNIPMFLFVITLLLLSFYLTGCASKSTNSTLFLKEDSSQLYNLQGSPCIESGLQVVFPSDNNTYELITLYINCDIHKNRIMESFEPKQWIIEKKKESK